MKPSSERLQKQPVSYDDEPCNERKCANCFENRGCMYDRYIVNASVEELNSQQIHEAFSPKKGMPSRLYYHAGM